MFRFAFILWHWMSGVIYVSMLMFLHSSLYICCSKDRRRNRQRKSDRHVRFDRIGPDGDATHHDDLSITPTSESNDIKTQNKVSVGVKSPAILPAWTSHAENCELEECERTQCSESTAKDLEEPDNALRFDKNDREAIIQTVHRLLDTAKATKTPLEIRCRINTQNTVLEVQHEEKLNDE